VNGVLVGKITLKLISQRMFENYKNGCLWYSELSVALQCYLYVIYKSCILDFH
jgi:hypothetical protein